MMRPKSFYKQAFRLFEEHFHLILEPITFQRNRWRFFNSCYASYGGRDVRIRSDAPFFVLGVLALVLVNGVFVAAEFAIVRVRRTRLEELAGQGVEAAKTQSSSSIM